MRIGAGDSFFWYDDWTSKGPLAHLVDFVNISDTEKSLRDVWTNGMWNLLSLSTIIPIQVKDVILQVSVPAVVNNNLDDTWIWKESKEGCYSAASGYAWLLSRNGNWAPNQDWNLEAQGTCQSSASCVADPSLCLTHD